MNTNEKEENNIHLVTSQVVEGCIECEKCSRDCRYLQHIWSAAEVLQDWRIFRSCISWSTVTSGTARNLYEKVSTESMQCTGDYLS